MLTRLWPRGDSIVEGLRAGIVTSAPYVFKKYGLTSPLVVAHAMAQFSHECGAGQDMIENIHYTAARAAQVWPLLPGDKSPHRRFRDAEDCYLKTHSWPGDPDFPGKLIDLVYGSRMGNRPGTHDGRTFIGRGLAQTTGRDGYARLAHATGLNVLDHPAIVITPQCALECGVADFVACGCLPYAEKDDVLQVSAMLNVGHTVSYSSSVVGFSQRVAWLKRWKSELIGVPAPPKTVNPINPTDAFDAAARSAEAQDEES